MRRNGLVIVIGLLLTVLAVAAIACDDEEEGAPETAAPTETTEATAEVSPQETAAETPPPEEGTAPSAATVVLSEHPELGTILTDAEGRTLYTFSEDPPNTSTCQTSPCPETWPPLIIESGTPVPGEGIPGQLDVITRDDGSLQVTYDGKPLHRFINDAAPEDANGQGVGGRWFVVQVSQ